MPFQRIPLGPFDEGVKHDRPSHQVRFTELTNFVIQDGKIRTRPGFQSLNAANQPFGDGTDVPTIEKSPIMAITEILNPGSSATGREGFTPAGEALAPDGSSDIVVGWTGSHLDVDENPPSGADVLTTSTTGAQKSLTFGNPVSTYEAVFGVVFHVRANMTDSTSLANLRFYQRVGGTNYKISDHKVTVTTTAETAEWQDIFVVLDRDLSTSRPLTDSDLDALELVIELEASESFAWERPALSSVGASDQWKDAGDGGAVEIGDCDGTTTTINRDGETNLPNNNHIVPASANDEELFITANLTKTFSTIDSIQVGGFFSRRFYNAPETILQMRYRLAGTTYDLGTESTMPAGHMGKIVQVAAATNPADSAAWANADVDNGEFGVEYVDGGLPYLGLFGITVYGSETGGGTVNIASVRAQVSGTTSSEPGNIDRSRLFSTNHGHHRLDNDMAPSVTDVTNSVPLDSTRHGWPLHHAVLYGQSYMVNGVDPTVRYPNGSTVYEELATNDALDTNPLTGRIVAAFGDRIFYGWVKDNTTVTPERIEYSREFNGGDHSDNSAGNIDILETQGGITGLVPMDEHNMFLGKEEGIYVVRRTGNSRAPFIIDMIDRHTGCLASKTAVAAQKPDGGQMVLFLGESPSYGPNVYALDGERVIPVGNPIADKLREDMSQAMARITSHAALDPKTGTYWLFIPEGTGAFPKQAWVMNLQTLAWTRAEFPWEVYSSGVMHWTDRTWANLETGTGSLGGVARLSLGCGSRGTPLPGMEVGSDEMSIVDDDNPQLFDAFTQTITTGDFVKEAGVERVSHRIGMHYKSLSHMNYLTVDASHDGGKTFQHSNTVWLTADRPDLEGTASTAFTKPTLDKMNFASLDLGSNHERMVRYRLRFTTLNAQPDGSTDLTDPIFSFDQRIEIHDLWVDVDAGQSDV